MNQQFRNPTLPLTTQAAEGLQRRRWSVADASLAYDRDRKARIYATFGVREVWVINAGTRETHCYRIPGLEGYADIRDVAADGSLVPELAPAPAVTLDRLELI